MAGGAADLPTDSKKEVRGPVSQTGSADLSLLQELFERLGHLVGTGCGFHPAADPLHALDRLLHRHPFQQTGDALEIPAASPRHLYRLDDSIFRLDLKLPGRSCYYTRRRKK